LLRGHIGHVHQFDIEDQVGFCGNSRMVRATVGHRARSIGHLPGDEDAALAADFHAGKSLVKADNRAANALRKRHRLGRTLLGLAVVPEDRLAVLVQNRWAGMEGCGVEDDSIGGPVAGVENLVQLAGLSHSAGADLDLLVTQGGRE
jgi:hypothetical protein